MSRNKGLVVITGASSGIGAAIAKALSQKGHPLLLLARRAQRMQALQLPETLCQSVDVLNASEVANAISEAEKKYGPVDCLINNAGVMLLGDAATQDPKEWEQMIGVNIIGVLNGIHAVLGKMKERRQGTIINISSIAGRKTFPNHAVYCGTKFAVHALSENIREEVSNFGVRVVTIAPGAVETELLGHTTSSEIKAGYESWKTQMGGALKPEAVAAAVGYAYRQPANVCIREIVIAATGQGA